MAEPRFAVLISGRGSNMEALVRASRSGAIPATCALVISSRPGARGLDVARDLGVETAVVDHTSSSSREEHDRRLLAALEKSGASLICLAGYMRLLSPLFIRAFPDAILNIHPSLLPAFPGLDVHRKALEHGVKLSGCTVHLVNAELDDGPIVAQAAVPVLDTDDENTLAARILEQEHRLYPEAVRLFFEDRLTVAGRRVEVRPPS